jgi:hypothetical protein
MEILAKEIAELPVYGTRLDTMSIKPDDLGTRGQGMRACRIRIPGYTKGLSRSTRQGSATVSAPAHVPVYGDQVAASLVG